MEEVKLIRGEWQCEKCHKPIPGIKYDKKEGYCQCNVEPLPEICKEHKPQNKEMGYVEHHKWIEEQTKKGIESKQCPKCFRWLFPCEW